MLPIGALTADAAGNLFGTTAYGGPECTPSCSDRGNGTVFQITHSGFVTGLLPPSKVAPTVSSLTYSHVSRTFNGTVTITNISGNTISGPFRILLKRLTAGVALANATGVSSGSPYLTVPDIASLASGQSATVSVQFHDPSFGPINFTPAVYAGIF
jgi:hypothetical protein